MESIVPKSVDKTLESVFAGDSDSNLLLQGRWRRSQEQSCNAAYDRIFNKFDTATTMARGLGIVTSNVVYDMMLPDEPNSSTTGAYFRIMGEIPQFIFDPDDGLPDPYAWSFGMPEGGCDRCGIELNTIIANGSGGLCETCAQDLDNDVAATQTQEIEWQD